jgi:2,4-dienoyl-CoA reductase-like NADH-dependent reductase (Old Yellow Enzyme family)
MTFGPATVCPTTAASYGSIALWDLRTIHLLRHIADGVPDHAGLVVSQTTHLGRRGSSRNVLTPVRGVSDLPRAEPREVASPSTSCPPSRSGSSTWRCGLHRCGWDDVEVTSFAHLIEQFWDPAINIRTDEYGGSTEIRMRFGKQVVAAVRAAVPDDFIRRRPRSGGEYST